MRKFVAESKLLNQWVNTMSPRSARRTRRIRKFITFQFLNFVLFAIFVVNTLFLLWLRLCRAVRFVVNRDVQRTESNWLVNERAWARKSV